MSTKKPLVPIFAGSPQPVPTSTARANLFQIVREVSESGLSVIVQGREGGVVRIIAMPGEVKPDVAKAVIKPAVKSFVVKIPSKKPVRTTRHRH